MGEHYKRLAAEVTDDALRRKTFTQLRALWNSAVVKELGKLELQSQWPLVRHRRDALTPEFANAPNRFESSATNTLRACAERSGELLSERREFYIEQRMEKLTQHLMPVMERETEHLRYLSAYQESLLREKLRRVSELQASLPSPRTFKRRLKIDTQNNLARLAVFLRYELFLIDDKLDLVDRSMDASTEAIASVINFVMGARRTFAEQFSRKEAEFETTRLLFERKTAALAEIARRLSTELITRAKKHTS